MPKKRPDPATLRSTTAAARFCICCSQVPPYDRLRYGHNCCTARRVVQGHNAIHQPAALGVQHYQAEITTLTEPVSFWPEESRAH